MNVIDNYVNRRTLLAGEIISGETGQPRWTDVHEAVFSLKPVQFL